MTNYKILHNSLTRKILNVITNDKKNEITILNSNNMNLISITIFMVFFLFSIVFLLYKSNFISLLDGSEYALNIVKSILSILFIVSLYSILLFGYIFYFYNLIKFYKSKNKILNDRIFYGGIKIFGIISIVITIVLFIFLKFDSNLILFKELSTIYSKLTIYGYFILFGVSIILIVGEYLYKYKNDFIDLYLLLILSIFPARIGYKLLSNKNKKMIYNSLLKIDNTELNEINAYLIFGNKIENFITASLFMVGWFYIIIQLIIGKISLNMGKIVDLIKEDITFSIILFILAILLFFIYKIFLTPSFIRNTYYVYLKEDKKISDI